jgi:predicted RNase H-like HicB family nuclease
MIIQWSEEDGAFLVSLPEWHGRVINPVTHGESYEHAAANGQDVLELLIESALDCGESLPDRERVTQVTTDPRNGVLWPLGENS